ncbi:MAG TPA: diguanylate phosphodiesterase [Acidobacteriota bacterium]|jgi:EAL domain-containing protein (putative c-di-GMP-specific phosphodiesterase class I)|nr:diguanylate phosphodiesterase [Acidobacteriota bacterium]HNU01084.1 diguanylate phosphodiesterase [Acidobacteriota bacterium]HPB27639.1 diguanylate phosphodiesterase [Acidobacteriota bacterium]HQO25233.1 diguanylate phosphodiesterase [Acidobacteriota bacterium]HQP73666.1 diguanylate phosphodiesterase [Acidobacteriota bacterium]
MTNLIHLIYCSAAARSFSREELAALLSRARANNARLGITGMLLHIEGSFFQVLEGAPDAVDGLFDAIRRDARHRQLTVIIREPVAARTFGEWTMGYADITPAELDGIVGANDFYAGGESFTRLGEGRAKKLLAAFRDGRWRSALSDRNAAPDTASRPAPESPPRFTFAFQPIIHAPSRSVFSYEALLRGRTGEPAATVLQAVRPAGASAFNEQCRLTAIDLAVRLGITTRLNLNFMPSDLKMSPTAVTSLLEAARRGNIPSGRIILEILESDIIEGIEDFAAAINAYRASGLTFAIDDFGSGYAGLNLLAEFQPDFVKLDMQIVRGIESRGPRQAIVRGILRTCRDLGIDVVAEGVETPDEYAWFRSEGIELFQGFLFARPGLECLPTDYHVPD